MNLIVVFAEGISVSNVCKITCVLCWNILSMTGNRKWSRCLWTQNKLFFNIENMFAFQLDRLYLFQNPLISMCFQSFSMQDIYRKKLRNFHFPEIILVLIELIVSPLSFMVTYFSINLFSLFYDIWLKQSDYTYRLWVRKQIWICQNGKIKKKTWFCTNGS